MASAFSDSLMASWGWKHPPKILDSTKGMTMKCLPDVGIYKRTQGQEKKFDITGPFCKVLEMQLLGMLTLRNFAGLSTLT